MSLSEMIQKSSFTLPQGHQLKIKTTRKKETGTEDEPSVQRNEARVQLRARCLLKYCPRKKNEQFRSSERHVEFGGQRAQHGGRLRRRQLRLGGRVRVAQGPRLHPAPQGSQNSKIPVEIFIKRYRMPVLCSSRNIRPLCLTQVSLFSDI